MTSAKDFTAIFQHIDGSYCFTIPDLPGFTAQIEEDEVDDETHARSMAEDILADYTGAMIEAGQEIPDPRSFGAIAANTVLDRRKGEHGLFVQLRARPRAGEPKRVNISLDTTTLMQIDEWARLHGLTRSAYLVKAAQTLR